jgi:hypothetical protein
MTLNDFYHAVVRDAVAASPQPIVVGGEEQGIPRAPWQGVPGRHMRGNIRKSDWVCVNCAKDLIERHAAAWYNRQLQVEYPPVTCPLFKRPNARNAPATPVRQQQQIQTAQSGSFFSLSTLKKGFSDIGEKFNEFTADAPSAPPPFPTPILPNPAVSTFSDRHVLQGNQLPGYPTFLATSRDSDGSPVFLAIFHHSSGAMLPGKICPNLRNPVRVAWEGSEYALTKDDKYETFLENPEVHKWVRMSNSVMPSTESECRPGSYSVLEV